MISAEDIANMSRTEKLRAIEAIWAQLANDAPTIPSPPWHREALAETAERVQAGEEKALHWDAAKRDLRDRAG